MMTEDVVVAEDVGLTAVQEVPHLAVIVVEEEAELLQEEEGLQVEADPHHPQLEEDPVHHHQVETVAMEEQEDLHLLVMNNFYTFF